MVIPDWTGAPKPPRLEFEPHASTPLPELLARPLDRLAAVIVDVFVMLVPVFVVLSAPFKRVLTASFILGSEPDFILQLSLMVLLAMVMLVAYQTLLHFFFQATFGKMLFDLRVKPVFGGEHLGFWACFARSCVWIVEVFPAGLPMLSVFSDPRRRTLHDRICDTVVVSRSTTAVGGPAPWERGLVRGFFAASFLFALMVGGFHLARFFEHFRTEKGLMSMLERDSAECEAVSKYADSGDEREHGRLQLAMSLYAAGLADRSCLEVELEREMAEQTPVGAISYLAQAFVNADDAEVSNSYLDQVCDESPSSIECTMSQVVSRWSEEDWEAVETLLKSADAGSGYLEVWAVRHFMKQARYQPALEFLDRLSDHKELASFSLVQRVRALYNSYHESEATVALAQALPALSKEEGEEIGSWMCAQQLQSGCGALNGLSCKTLPSGTEISEIDFERPAAALARVMALECQDGNSLDYRTFGDSVRDQDWQTFFRANLKQQKDDRQGSFRLYSDVIGSTSAPDLLRVEALRRLSQFADRAQMKKIVDLWRGFDSRESWIKAGNLLFARSIQHKDRDTALRVARHLMSYEALSPSAVAQLEDMVSDRPERKPANARGKEKEELRLMLDSYEDDE
jgi:uncharacterized RDD family membrane protein YckC